MPAEDLTNLNPASLPIHQLAQLLSRAAREPVTVETIEEDIRAGAPTNADGTIHLAHYAAWLIRERLR